MGLGRALGGAGGLGGLGVSRGAIAAGAICTMAAVVIAPASAAGRALGPPHVSPAPVFGQALASPAAAGSSAPRGPSPFSGAQLAAAGRTLGDRSLLLQTAGGGTVAALVSLRDDAWTRWMAQHRPFGGDAYDVGYQIGHRRTQAALALAITAGGFIAHDGELRDTGLLLAQAQLVSAGLAQVLKAATDRQRPDGGDRNSLPSGHAVSAWTMAEVLQRRHGWWIGGPAFAAALYTGASRVQGRRHHPSDVLAGFALAHWIGAAVCRSVQPAHDDRAGVRWLPPGPGPGGCLALLQARF